jgi:hypothetical protein
MTTPGQGVDSEGRPVIDPTQNVLDLVQAAIQRQDDLREMSEKMAELRAQHSQEMRRAEADRLNAIREVDVGAVQRAAEVQLAQATALATQTATLAETLRAGQAQALVPLQAAIDELRRAQYEAQGGRAQVVETRAGVGDSRSNVGMIVGIIGAGLALIGVTCSGLAIATTVVVALTR